MTKAKNDVASRYREREGQKMGDVKVKYVLVNPAYGRWRMPEVEQSTMNSTVFFYRFNFCRAFFWLWIALRITTYYTCSIKHTIFNPLVGTGNPVQSHEHYTQLLVKQFLYKVNPLKVWDLIYPPKEALNFSPRRPIIYRKTKHVFSFLYWL